MSSKEATPPKVFISYSHDSPEHDERVLALADRLNHDGIDCMLDQYIDSPREGWPRWMDGQMREVDFVLVICTATYNRRAMGKEEPGKGLGLRWESTLAYQYLYNAGTANDRFIPVLLEGASTADIPTPLQGATHYRLPLDYDVLYRRLTGQHPTPKPPVGTLRPLPPHERPPRSFETAPQEHTSDSITSAPGQISTPAVAGKQAPLWTIPYERNSLFTGREDILKHLSTALRSGKTTALSQPQAISGLGGIGKTQTAIEYAYRYQDDYDAVLWVRAESRETLTSDFVTLAHVLNLPEQQEQEQQRAIDAVKRWFHNHTRWLLILDNADDLNILRDFLRTGSQRHILLTTRSQVTGRIAQRIELDQMEPEEGILFLLRRAYILDQDAPLEAASKSDRDQAREIVLAMDGLPLALDQAGAYIDETKCGLSGYLRLYRTRQADLLKQRGKYVTEHQESVTTTLSLSFEKVQQANPAAADLLRLCAFLDPDAISEEIITKGAPHLGPTLQPVAADPIKLNDAIRDLLTYSLIQRNPDQTLTIHRLVQAVLKHRMNKTTQRRWAERTVQAVNLAFPDVTDVSRKQDVTLWKQYEPLLPHALACAELIKHWNFTFPEARRLPYETGRYLFERAQYGRAEELYQISKQVPGTGYPETAKTLHALAWLYRILERYDKAESLSKEALAIREQVLSVLGDKDPDTANVLHELALACKDQGRDKEAESLFTEALQIREQVLGPEDPLTADSLHHLAWFYQDQGRYKEVEPFFQRALAIREQVLSVLGDKDPDTASILHEKIADSLHALAWLYQIQGKYKEAEPLYQQALKIRERVLGTQHPWTAETLHAMGQLYQDQGRYKEAESLFTEARKIREQVLGPQHEKTADSLYALAWLYQIQGRYKEAEPLYQQALEIREQVLGTKHRDKVSTLRAMGQLYQIQGRYKEVEPLYQRALEIREQVLPVSGDEHADTASTLHELAWFYHIQGRYEEAEPLYQQALKIRERVLGPQHEKIADSLHALAWLCKDQRRYKEAESLFTEARKIREQVLGPEHPLAAETLHAIGQLYQDQDRYEEAEPLYQRAIAIDEKMLGPEHPNLARDLNNLATLYLEQGKYAQAEPLYLRAIAIGEKVLGPEHPLLAIYLNNLANLYSDQGKYEQAEPLFQRALAIREQVFGPTHPLTDSIRENYTALLEQMKQKESSGQDRHEV